MNYTTNYNLNKPEGTDLYNHLTVDNPNMDTIDGAMYSNKLQAIGTATELVSGTVHALTRADSDQNIFKFKATGDFHLGDTITVDGVSVNAYTTAGQQLLEEAYVLSAEVLCILDVTNLWVYVNKIPDGSEVAYDAVDSVNDKIDDINTFLGMSGWTSYPTPITGGTYPFYVRKTNRTVEAYFFTDKSITSDITLCNLADEFKPTVPRYPYAIYQTNQTGLTNAVLTVANDGTVSISADNSSQWKIHHLTWLH